MRNTLVKKYGWLIGDITAEEESIYQTILASKAQLEKFNKEELFLFLEKIITPANRSIDFSVLASEELDLAVLTDILLDQGANINFAVFAIALNNDQERVIDLMGRGADKNWALMGAISGEHNAFAENLIQHYDADIKEAMRITKKNKRVKLAKLNESVHAAALLNKEALVMELISLNNASVNHALNGALMGGHTNLAKRLIHEFDAIAVLISQNQRAQNFTKADESVFFEAQVNHETEVMQLILQKGANKNWALAGAIARNNKTLELKLIQQYEARLWQAFEAAIKSNDEATAMKIFQKMRDPVNLHYESLSLCLIAANNNRQDILIKILKINRQESPTYHDSLIEYCINNANLETIASLIDLLEYKSNSAIEKAISNASSRNSEEYVIKLLREYSHFPDLINAAVKAAVECNHEALVIKLINMGADINSAVEAIVFGCRPKCRLLIKLIDMGADIDKAINACVKNNRQDIQNILIQLYKKEHASSPDPSCMKLAMQIFEEKKHAELKGEQVNELIHAAAVLNQEAFVIKLILQNDASVDHAFDGALTGGHPELAKRLIQEFDSLIRISQQQAEKFTKLDESVFSEAQMNHETEVMQLILQKGANKNWALAGAIAGKNETLEVKLIQQCDAKLKQAFEAAIKSDDETTAMEIFQKMREHDGIYSASCAAGLLATKNDSENILINVLEIHRQNDRNNHDSLIKHFAEYANPEIMASVIGLRSHLPAYQSYDVIEKAISNASSKNNEELVIEILRKYSHYPDLINAAVKAAARCNHEALVIKLINMGADKNSALAAAMQSCAYRLVIKLIDMGADIDKAIDASVKNNQDDMRKILIQLYQHKNEKTALPHSSNFMLGSFFWGSGSSDKPVSTCDLYEKTLYTTMVQ